MDDSTPSDSSKTTVSSRKWPFSCAERELVVTLVQEWPIIENKHTNAKNIELKRQAWEELAQAYNSQPYVSHRSSHQLKRCWENIKTLRKRELSQGSMTSKRTGGPSGSGTTLINTKKFVSETSAKIKRTTLNIQQDRELHELRIEREKILLQRETNFLDFEKQSQELQLQKIKLEIELLTKQIDNKT